MPRTNRPLKSTAGVERSKWRRWVAWFVYITIGVLIGLIVWWTRSMILPFIIALLLAYIFEPIIGRLKKLHVPRIIGTLVVYAVLAAASIVFMYFLVPIIDEESKKFAVKFGDVIKKAPSMYDSLEGSVGDLVDGLAQSQEPESPAEGGAPKPGLEGWGFGPPVNRVPVVQLPGLPVVPELSLTSTAEDYDAAGVSGVPNAKQLKLEGGVATLAEESGRPSAMTVEMVRPGLFAVDFGDSPIEVQKSGEQAWTISTKTSTSLHNGFSDLRQQVVSAMRQGLQQVSSELFNGLLSFFQGLLTGLLELLIGLIVVVLVGAFAMVDGPEIVEKLRQNVPRRWRSDFDDLMARLDKGLSGAIRGQLLICLINGLLSTIGFLIFIPDYAIVLGILAGVLSLVPIFGTIISSAPAVLIALTDSFGTALGVMAWILGVHVLDAYFMSPNIIGSRAKIHPIMIIFVLMVGEAFFGVKGILLAVPAASIVQNIILFAYSKVKREVI